MRFKIKNPHFPRRTNSLLFKKVKPYLVCSLWNNHSKRQHVSKGKLFLQLIAYSEDKKQKFQIIKCINHNQYFELKKIAINILQGVLPLKKDQLKYLKNSKTLIRKLAEGKVTNNYLATHYMIISYIVKIALEYRSGTVNSNTVNSKFHLIRSCCEYLARFLSFHV